MTKKELRKKITSILKENDYSLGCYNLNDLPKKEYNQVLKELKETLMYYDWFNIILENGIVEIENINNEIDLNYLTIQDYYETYGEYPNKD